MCVIKIVSQEGGNGNIVLCNGNSIIMLCKLYNYIYGKHSENNL